METRFCVFCNRTGWVDIRVDPPEGEDGFGPVDQDIDSCPLCNPGGSTQDYFDLPDDIKENIPYYLASAVGGYDPQYLMFQSYDENGNQLSGYIVETSVFDFVAWHEDPPVRSCPVCLGWGIWSHNGNIQDCIACGGQPIQARQGFQPLHAWWLRELWPNGSRIFRQRGVPGTEPLSCSEMLRVLDSMPGLTTIS